MDETVKRTETSACPQCGKQMDEAHAKGWGICGKCLRSNHRKANDFISQKIRLANSKN